MTIGILLASGHKLAVKPHNTVAPVISGFSTVGYTLSTTDGTWNESPTTFTYQWVNQSLGNIAGATSSSYTTTNAEIGYQIYCDVFGFNDAGASLGASTGLSATCYGIPSNISAPTTNGVNAAGSAVSVTNTGTWSGGGTFTYTYQWYASSSGLISGATSSSYTISSTYAGQQLRCLVTASNGNDVGLTGSAYTAFTSVVTNKTPNVEYLVIAGGGSGGVSSSGGTYWGGGGGAGGYRTATGLAVPAGSALTVTVGSGGTAATAGLGSNSGLNSVFYTITSTGGGGGGFYAPGSNAKAGGSGGGGVNTVAAAGGTATPAGQGNTGGTNGIGPGYGSGGGGSFAAVGGTGTTTVGGTGAASTSSSITGAAVAYAAGGGGGAYTAAYNGGPGGTTGGGTASKVTPATAAAAGAVNTGSGGGGQGSGRAEASGAGGSGIVIIRYLSSYDAAVATTGTPSVTISGSYRVYRWTGSGSITF